MTSDGVFIRPSDKDRTVPLDSSITLHIPGGANHLAVKPMCDPDSERFWLAVYYSIQGSEGYKGKGNEEFLPLDRGVVQQEIYIESLTVGIVKKVRELGLEIV